LALLSLAGSADKAWFLSNPEQELLLLRKERHLAIHRH
jgi:hypothetical protein